MTQADAPTGHRWGSLGDVPDPPEGDRVPLYSVDISGSLPLNDRRLLSYFQICLWTPEGLFFLSVCLSVWQSVLFVLLYPRLINPGMMGQRQSSPTPLSLMTEYFKEVKKGARDLSVKIKKDKLLFAAQNGCLSIWAGLRKARLTWKLRTKSKISSSDRRPDTLTKSPIS